jgi:dihydroflavonol-4-reductase
MRLIIIGATGMLGHHTLRAAMQAGHETAVVYRNDKSLEKLSVQPHHKRLADVNDKAALTAALSGFDAVIHAAAYYPTTPKPWQQELQLARTGMQTFLDAVRDSGIAKAVYLGGAIALPKRSDGKPADGSERYTSPPQDHNPYVQCKWAMDEMALLASEKEGLPILVGIPSMTFGEYDWGPTTGQLLTGIAKRTQPKYVQGNRNVVYAGDAGNGLVLAALNGKPGRRYVFTGENTDMQTLTAMAARIAQVPAPTAAPLAIAKLLNRMQTLRYKLGGATPSISETAIAVMSSGQHLDGHVARDELGYAPTQTLEKTLTRTLAWFREQGMVK